MQADGNCMYHALAHQLELHGYEGRLDDAGATPAHVTLRQRAAAHVRAHGDAFLPFIARDGDAREPAEQLESYCRGVEGSEWGTQVELQALVAELKLPITVRRCRSVTMHAIDALTGVMQGRSPAAHHRASLSLTCYAQLTIV